MHRLFTVLACLLVLAAGVAPVAAQTPASIARLPLTGDRLAAFEEYVGELLAETNVPGAAVAVVQNGQIVVARGFGLRERETSAPVTAETLLLIGSVNKPMTSLMAATLVDDGLLAWDTPVVELLPDFAVADPALTRRLTVADAFCACTGLPRRDVEVMFNFDRLTPDRLIASVAGLPLAAPLGELYQYSNQMYAVGGYAAATAAGGSSPDLYGAYVAAMRDRVLAPIGMDRSTYALTEALASGDHAIGYATNLDGETLPVPLALEDGYLSPGAPAGALWSSATDMARYLQTVLADGVAAGGERVVSAENLQRTREPRVTIPTDPNLPPVFAESDQFYGMGWVVGAYNGQPMLAHTGGTAGFVSKIAVLPEADAGIVVLTNGGGNAPFFITAVQYRLFELLFGQAPAMGAMISQVIGAQAAQLAQLRARLRDVEPDAVAPYLGSYVNPTLGEITLSLEGERLLLDAGELRWALRPMVDDAGQMLGYVFTDPPFAGAGALTMRQLANSEPELTLTIPGETTDPYVFRLTS